jgi:hypothetical protein
VVVARETIELAFMVAIQHLPPRSRAVLIVRDVLGWSATETATLREDARFSMPPQPGLYEGRDTIIDMWREGGFSTEELGRFRCLTTSANRQPAVACYVQRPGKPAFSALALDVLRIEAGGIAEVMTFDSSVFAAFGLPPAL